MRQGSVIAEKRVRLTLVATGVSFFVVDSTVTLPESRMILALFFSDQDEDAIPWERQRRVTFLGKQIYPVS